MIELKKEPALAGEQRAGLQRNDDIKLSYYRRQSNTTFKNFTEYKIYLEDQFSLENRMQGFVQQETRLIHDQFELLKYQRETGKPVQVYCRDESFLKQLLDRFRSDPAFISKCFAAYRLNKNVPRENIYTIYKGLL